MELTSKKRTTFVSTEVVARLSLSPTKVRYIKGSSALSIFGCLESTDPSNRKTMVPETCWCVREKYNVGNAER